MLRLSAARAAMFWVCLSLSISGCASSYCAEPEHAQDAMCQLNLGGTVAAYTVSPPRIPINKGVSTQLVISAYPKLVNQAAQLTQSGGIAKPIPLGLVGQDGMLAVMIRASDLAAKGFVPGAADVEIAGQKRRIRIFVAPSFDSSAFAAVRNINADQGSGNLASPSWVGVQAGPKKILTLNEYSIATIAKQAIGEYAYDPGNKAIPKFSPPLFSAYGSAPNMDALRHTIALSMSDLVIPEYGNASISLLTRCSLDGVCASVAVPYGNISFLSTDSLGQIYAGMFNGKLAAFADAKLATGVPIIGSAASAAPPAAVALFDVNEDTLPDLVIWHADGSVSVALSDSNGKSLTYDPKAGARLQGLGVVGNAAPDAVAVGDIDQDGLEDVVLAQAGSLYILSNEGGGTFSAGAALAIPMRDAVGSVILPPVTSLAIGDVSAGAAGLKDLVLASKPNSLLAVMENTATAQ